MGIGCSDLGLSSGPNSLSFSSRSRSVSITDRRFPFGAITTLLLARPQTTYLPIIVLEIKKPSIRSGTKGLAPWYHPDQHRRVGPCRSLCAVSGAPSAIMHAAQAADRRVGPLGGLDAQPGLHYPRLAGGWLTTPAHCTYYVWAEKLPVVGGPRGIRTLDLLNAIETRSQLRYGPRMVVKVTVDLEGFEPSTFSVRLRRAPNCATGPRT